MSQKHVFGGVVAASVFVFFAVGIMLAPSHSAMAMAMYVAAGAVAIFVEFVTWRIHFLRPRLTVLGMTGAGLLVKTLGLSLLIALILEALTLFGAPLSSVLKLGDWNPLRIAFFFALSYVICLLALIGLRERLQDTLDRVKSCLSRVRFGRAVAIIAATLAAAAVLSAFVSQAVGLAFFATFAFFSALLGTVAFFVCNIQQAKAHPERFFLVAALLFGSYLAFVLPTETNISWDDQIHYKRSLALSYIVDSEYSDADSTLLDPTGPDERLGRPPLKEDSVWPESDLKDYHDRLNQQYVSGGYHSVKGFNTAPEESTIATYSTIGYVPSAIGLWLGRLLHLPLSLIFDLGRWMNLLAYCFVAFAAIKIIPTKKILLSAVALLPTNLFLASNYSYDPWVTAFIFLAVAMIVRELSAPDKKLARQSWVAMLLVFFVALGPKAIYFPLIGLLFLLPKSKFLSGSQRRRFIASVVILGCVVVASFLLPFLASGGGSGDARGGGDVNPSAQVAFILSNPFEYALTLASFFANDYLTLVGSNGYTVHFAYLGQLPLLFPWTSMLPVVFLLTVALTDVDAVSERLASIPHAAWMGFLFIVTVVLIATSLYVSFTSVGADTVDGCQHRYLAPLIFPLLALCFNMKMRNESNRTVYNLTIFSAALLLMAICCWYMVALKMVA